MKRHAIRTLFAAVGVVALTLIGASAANATTPPPLPTGMTVNVTGCFGSFASLDSATMTMTSDNAWPGDCLGGSAVNPLNGKVYVPDVAPNVETILEYDPVTHTVTNLGPATYNGQGLNSMNGIAFAPDGTGYVEDIHAGLVKLDLSAPTLTVAGSAVAIHGTYCDYIVIDPISGNMYGDCSLTWGTRALQLIDPVTGTETEIVPHSAYTNGLLDSLAFDGQGGIWTITGPNAPGQAGTLWRFTDLADIVGTRVSYGDMTLGSGGFLNPSSTQYWWGLYVTAPPAAPTSVTAASDGSTVTVSWGATAGATSYTADLGGGLSCTVNTPATSCAISNVPDGNYTVSVTATNTFGTSAVGAAPSQIAVGSAGQPSLASTGANTAPFDWALALLGVGVGVLVMSRAVRQWRGVRQL